MIEAFAFILLRKRLPVELGSLQQTQCAHHIGAGKGEWVFDATIDMRFGSKVNDAVNLLVLHQLVESIEVADVHLDELLVRFFLDVLQVCEVSCIRQLVKVDDFVLWVFVHEKAYDMRADKACTTGDYYSSFVFHNHFCFLFVHSFETNLQ